MSDAPTPEVPLIRNPPPQPLFSVRRFVILGFLVLAFGILYVTYGSAQTNGGGTGCSNEAVAAFDPCPGGRVLRQAQVGVELKTGYDGRISINGIAIPEDQMVGAIVPGSAAYAQLSAEERALGPRPNNKNVVKFQPGEGRAIDKFNGELDVAITFWKISEGSTQSQTITYTVFVL